MQIYCENGYYPNCHFAMYKYGRSWQISNYHKNLNSLLSEHKFTESNEHYFLLNEKRFNYFSFCIFQETEKKFTIRDLEKILEEKKIEAYPHSHKSHFLSYFIDRIFIDGEETDFLLAKHGKIFFRLNLIYIDDDTINLFDRCLGKKRDPKKIHIYPRSFFTQQFLKNQLQRESYYLLDIGEEASTLLTMQGGFYKAIETVNLGTDTLKSIYKENEIIAFFGRNHGDIGINYFTEQTIKSSVSFFNRMLTKWLQQFLEKDSDLILMGDIGNNHFFQESFKNWYQNNIQGFLIPFTHAQGLNTYAIKRSANDLHALTLINQRYEIEEQKK